jgi:RimJ/RimL family protein N-acetyltransferase
MVRDEATRLGVFLGGTPGPGLLTLVGDVVARIGDDVDRTVEVQVFGGGDLAPLRGPRVVQRGLVDDVPRAAGQLDVALAAAGTTTWELCRAGVPTVLVAAADNQVPIVEAVVAAGAALGEARLLPEAAGVAHHVTVLLADHDLRAGLADRARTLVDGRGPLRVAAALRSRDVVLRAAGADDEGLLLDWANDPDVRASSFESHVIPADTHHVWLARRLADPEVGLYVAEDGRGPWGQIRFEPREPGTVELGFSIDARRRGEGLAAPLLRAGVRRAFADLPGADRILGRVRPENHRSARAFDAAGFVPVDEQPHAFVADRREGW